MLSDAELRDRLTSSDKTDRIELHRAFPVAAEPDTEPGHSDRDNTVAHLHITLSLGRLIKPLTTTSRVKPSIRFQGHPHLIDLKRCDDGWPLSPGQSAVVFTNEWIRLPADVTGLTFSRVSQYNNGIVVAASYVDPRWRGLVKLHLLNSSGRTYRLHLGTPIAHLALLQIEGQMLPELDDRARGRHYGITWAQILRDEVDPFPQKQSRVRWHEAIRNTNELLKTYAGYGLLALLVLGVLGGLRLYDQLDVAQRVAAMEQSVGTLEAARVIAGVETVTVPANSASGTSAITVPDGLAANADSFALARSAPSAPRVRTTAAVRFRSNVPKLEIGVELPQPVPRPTDVAVEWFLVP